MRVMLLNTLDLLLLVVILLLIAYILDKVYARQEAPRMRVPQKDEPEAQRLAQKASRVEPTDGGSVKLKKYPSVHRGVVTEIGLMMQTKQGREFETFGVKYETQEGIVEAVFGVNLRDALREAKVSVGDRVEILKIGRKTIEKGKAPMNLFAVAKLK